MAFCRDLTCFLLFLAILMAVSPAFVQTSRPCLQVETKMAESIATQGLLDKFGNGDSGFGTEDSAREVPTGPDPLHHKSNPTGP